MSEDISYNSIRFSALQNLNYKYLFSLNSKDIKAILPSLTRITLCHPLDLSPEWSEQIKDFWHILYQEPNVSNIISCLDINFLNLEKDAIAEKKLLSKNDSLPDDSMLVSATDGQIIADFDAADHDIKARLLLRDLLRCISIVQKKSKPSYIIPVCKSEFFDEINLIQEVFDITACLSIELRTVLSIEDLCAISLCMKYGMQLLSHIIVNQPIVNFKIVEVLLKNCNYFQDETTVQARRCSQLISGICDLDRRILPWVKYLATSLHKMPSLTINCTMKLETGLLTFLSSILLSENYQPKHNFKDFIKQGLKRRADNEKTNINSIFDCIRSEFENILSKFDSITLPDNLAMEACNLLKVVCIFRGSSSLKFNEKDQAMILQLICKRQPFTIHGNRLVCIALCTLMVCPTLVSQKFQEKQVVDWIKWLSQHQSQFHFNGSSETSYGEILLLTAIHFHSNQLNEVSELANDIIGIKNFVKSSTLLRLRILFTNEIFPEQLIVKHAIKVKPTKKLNNNMTGYLPIHCVIQLLKNHSFAKHKIPIKDWILAQIKQARAPLHCELSILITEFVQSCLNLKLKAESRNEPLNEDEILNLFKEKNSCHKERQNKMNGNNNVDILVPSDLSETNILFDCLDNFENELDKYFIEEKNLNEKQDKTSQILLLYYLLQYQDIYANNLQSTKTEIKEQIFEYSSTVFDQIPIHALIVYALENPEKYENIIPTLQRLLVQHFPHLCLVEEWIDYENRIESEIKLPNIINDDNLESSFQSCMENNGSALLIQLQIMQGLNDDDLLKYSETYLCNISKFLDDCIPRIVVEIACSIWNRLHAIMPRKLRVITVNKFLAVSNMYQTNVTQEQLTIEPLLILKCDNRIFKCAPFLTILLRILESFLLASKLFFNQKSNELSKSLKKIKGQDINKNENDDLSDAIIMAQEATSIQILLDLCLKHSENKLNWQVEMRCVIFQYIHRCFINNPALCKLIHFQGYPNQLIPLVVEGIPSMHICLDFIAELLAQPQNDKKIFALDLLSHICLHYSLPKTLALSKLAVNILSTMLTYLTHYERTNFFINCLKPLSRIAKSFPPLRDSIISILVQLAHIILDESMVLGLSPRAMQALDNLTKPNVDYIKIDKGKQQNLHIELCYDIRECFKCILKQTIMTADFDNAY